MKERVQKLLAEANIASRRTAEEMIEQGRVRVNGEIIHLGDKADKDTDVIEVDGTRIKFDDNPKRYIALYKPMQTLSTTQPHESDDRDTIYDFVPFKDERLFSIGRLDADSEGLIVLTNDGEMAERLSHPRFRHTKTYRVTVIGLPTAETIERWERGIDLEDGVTAPCSVKITKGNPRESILRVTMTEGKKRQIRRVAAALGHPVRRLIRTHIGMLSAEDLNPGEWRELNKRDIEQLQTPMPEIKTLRGRKAGDHDSGQDDPNRPRRYRRDGDNERPRRDSGDRRRSPRAASGEREDRPRREWDRGGDRPSRPRRDDRSESSERETPSWRRGADAVMQTWDADRRPQRDDRESRGDRPYRPRRDGESGRDRSRREGSGDRPYRPRRDGDSNDRPRREGSGDRPYRPRRDGDSGGSRPPRREGGGDRPYRPRRDGDSGSSRPPRREGGGGGDRPYRPRRDGDSNDRPRREGGGDRPYRPRRDGDSNDRPRREGGGGGDRPYRPRRDGDSGGSRPPRREESGDRPYRPRRDGDSNDRPRSGDRGGNRSGGNRSGRPGGRSGNRSGDRSQGRSSDRSSNRPANRRPRSDSSDRPPRRERKDESDE